MKLQDQVVVITGAASGIGLALAHAYAQQGARLALADVDVAGLEDAANALRLRAAAVLVQRCDVAQAADWRLLAERVSAELGPADALINNAGVALADTVVNMSEADAQWLIGINFWGVFHGCRAFLPQLSRHGVGSEQHGTIVNISSVFAMVSTPTQSIYNASKAAVRAFSDSLREELREQGVQVLCVHPGGINTRIAANARVGDLGGMSANREEMVADFPKLAVHSPQFAASKILNAHLKGKSRLMVGAEAYAFDWLYRLRPQTASRRFTQIMQFANRRLRPGS